MREQSITIGWRLASNFGLLRTLVLIGQHGEVVELADRLRNILVENPDIAGKHEQNTEFVLNDDDIFLTSNLLSNSELMAYIQFLEIHQHLKQKIGYFTGTSVSFPCSQYSPFDFLRPFRPPRKSFLKLDTRHIVSLISGPSVLIVSTASSYGGG